MLFGRSRHAGERGNEGWRGEGLEFEGGVIFKQGKPVRSNADISSSDRDILGSNGKCNEGWSNIQGL